MFLGMSVVNSDIKLKLEPIQEATEILYEKFPHNVDKEGIKGNVCVSRFKLFLSLLSHCGGMG
jgi:hypothetical protein